MRIQRIVLAVIGLGVAFAVASPALAEGPAVTSVFVVEVEPANTAAYMDSLKEAQSIIKGLGLPGFSVLRATAAGTSTGTLAIIVNAENLVAWAQNSTKLQADPGWMKWVAGQQAAGLGDIISNNLWVEVLAP